LLWKLQYLHDQRSKLDGKLGDLHDSEPKLVKLTKLVGKEMTVGDQKLEWAKKLDVLEIRSRHCCQSRVMLSIRSQN